MDHRAGWYPDPAEPWQLRYFDGEQWTEEVRPSPAPEPWQAADVEEPAHRRRWWVPVLVGMGLLTAAGGAVLTVTMVGDAAEPVDVAQTEPPEVSPSSAGETQGSADGEVVAPPSPPELRDINWVRHPWPTTCTPQGADEPVNASLSVGNEPGVYSYSTSAAHDGGSMEYSVWLDDVVYVDVTDSGHDEAIFRARCFFGNEFEHYVLAWTIDDEGEPVQLPPLLAWTKFSGQIDVIDEVDGKLRTITSEPAPGDGHPHLNGYPVEVVTEWAFGGEEWVSTEVTRSQRPLAECESPNSSPENAVDCLLAATVANDAGAAMKAASAQVVDAVQAAHDEGRLDTWTFMGCESGQELGASFCAFDEPMEDWHHGVLVELWVASSDRGWVIEGIDYFG